MLAKVVSKSQRDWDERLPFVMSAYRATVHNSTGYSPNRLFLGRENRMPIDVAMGLDPRDNPEAESTDDFVQRQQDVAEESYRLAREHLGQSAERRKCAYDTRVKPTKFQRGEWVWYYYPRRYLRKSPK